LLLQKKPSSSPVSPQSDFFVRLERERKKERERKGGRISFPSSQTLLLHSPSRCSPHLSLTPDFQNSQFRPRRKAIAPDCPLEISGEPKNDSRGSKNAPQKSTLGERRGKRLGSRGSKRKNSTRNSTEVLFTPQPSLSFFLSFFLRRLSLLEQTSTPFKMLLRASSAPAPASLAGSQSRAAGASSKAPKASSSPSSSRRRRIPAAAFAARRPMVAVSALAEAPLRAPASTASSSTPASSGGHAALLHGLGAVGDVPPKLMPFLLRLAHVK
jgi:hypothetical protein